jgi:hypothetical protein
MAALLGRRGEEEEEGRVRGHVGGRTIVGEDAGAVLSRARYRTPGSAVREPEDEPVK